jgi:hypothetical protein
MYLREYPFRSVDLLTIMSGIVKIMKQGMPFDWMRSAIGDMAPIVLKHLKENPFSPETLRRLRIQLIKVLKEA